MAKTVYLIKQELENLEKNVASLAVDLETAYQQYLHSLGKSAAKQLILACYQICTRSYPQAFLRLSVNQREKLQQSLQKLATEIEANLLSCMPQTTSDSEPQESSDSIDSNQEKTGEEFKELREVNPNEYYVEVSPANQGENKPLIIKTPEDLSLWNSLIEKGINQVLKNVSKDVNCLLLQQDLFPQKFPEKLFEIALQAEEKNSIAAGIPNLLNLLIEKGKEGDSQPKRVDPITAIKLRLSELEFADSTLDKERGQIRTLLSKLENIREQYRIKQKECAIAEAEAAWRAVWYEQ